MKNQQLADKIWKSIEKAEYVFLGITMICVFGILVISALIRYTPFRFLAYEEIVLFIAFWMYMVGATRCTRTKTMVVADVINLLCKNVKITDAVSMLEKILTFGLNVLFFSWAFQYIVFSMGLSALSPILKIPFYIVHWSVVFGLGLMVVYNFVHMIERFITLRNIYFRAVPESIEGGDR